MRRNSSTDLHDLGALLAILGGDATITAVEQEEHISAGKAVITLVRDPSQQMTERKLLRSCGVGTPARMGLQHCTTFAEVWLEAESVWIQSFPALSKPPRIAS